VAEEAIRQAADFIRSWGLQPVIGKQANSQTAGVYAGTADERAADLRWALEDESIKAIICARGGYGSIHLMARIPLECYQEHPKWLIGHGDITTLLYAVAGAGLMSVHGPLAFQIASGQEPTSTLLKQFLLGTVPQYTVPANPYNHCGHAEGILVGGNLSSLAAISGTKFQLPTDQDIILFIEEMEEPLHAIDRLFYMLRLQSGFEKIKGVIFGSFNSIKYDLHFGSVEQMLLVHLRNKDIPICCGFPIGVNSCMPLIEGAPCSLDVTNEQAVLTFNIEGKQETFQIEKEDARIMR
jgi:muramoyltetrapeptide carboxypeptidase